MALKSYAIAVSDNIIRNHGGHISRVCIGHQVQDSITQARRICMNYIPQKKVDPQDIYHTLHGPSAVVMFGGRTIGGVDYDTRLGCYTYSDHKMKGTYRLNSDGSLGNRV